MQSLKPEDLPRRVRFCEWLLQKNREQPDFVQKLLTTDEATFTREGVFNSRNTHIWSDENPHAIRETHFQDRFSVNVWAGMVDNNLIGPYVLPPRLTAVAYLHFLNNDLGPLLENVPLNVRRDLWYLHDGAPARYTVEVREWFDRNFPNK